MNILYICSEYPPYNNGGIGSFTQSIGRYLSKLGHNVTVVGVYDVKENRTLKDENVTLHMLPRGQGRFRWIINRWVLFREVQKICKANSISLIEAPDFEGMCAFWPNSKIPLISRLHGSLSYFSKEMQTPINPMTQRLEKRSLKRSPIWVSTNKYTLKKTKSLFNLQPKMEEVIYNFVHPPASVDFAKKKQFRIVFTGTLVEKKGVFQLMKAWNYIRKKIPNAELHIYGKDTVSADGKSAKEKMIELLDTGFKDSIVFHGHVTREQIANALSEAAIAIFPSYAEAFALAPMEAMAQGCATIYSQRGSGNELIANGVDGFLINPDNPQEISAAACQLLESSELRSKVALKGREKIINRFSIDVIMKENLEFYQKSIVRNA